MPARQTCPLVLIALALALLITAAGVTTAPRARSAPSEPATAPLPNGLSVDGFAHSFARAGDTLYVTGDFSYLGERVRGMTVLDAQGRIPAGLPRGDAALPLGFARQIIPDGVGGWFVALNGVIRLDANLQPLPGWPVSVSHSSGGGQVNALALYDGVLYIAGAFTAVAGQPRAGLAALDPASGVVLPWTAPGATGNYHRITLDNTMLYTVGYQDSQGAVAAAVRRDDGAGGWSVKIGGSSFAPSPDLIVDGGRVYIGGDVYGLGPDGVYPSPDDSRGLLVLDAATGAEVGPWPKVADGEVVDIAVGPDTIYLTGSFRTVNGQPRAALAAIDRADGTLRPWPLGLTFKDGAGTTDLPAVGYDLALDGDTLYVGGFFDAIGGQPRRNLAALNPATGALLPWRGSANREIYELAAAGGRVLIAGEFTLAGGSPGADAAAIDLATGRARFWEPRHTGTRPLSTPGRFGYNGSYVYYAATLGDHTYLGLSSPTQPKNPPALALDSETAALHPWSAPADAIGALAVGGGKLLISRAGTSTTAVVAAYGPLGVTPLWERTVSANNVWELLVDGEVVYGVAYTSNTGQTNPGSVFALRLADGALLWERPVAGFPVALALEGGRLYLGGRFQSIGADAAVNLAALDPASGDTLPWPAGLAPDNLVFDLAADEGRLYLTGFFSAVGDTARRNVAAIDLGASPTLAAWEPLLPASTSNVLGLAVTDGSLYLGAAFPDGSDQTSRYGMLVFPLSPQLPTVTPTGSATAAPASPTATATPTSSPTGSATAAPASPTATATPTSSPTGSATAAPTSSPTGSATAAPASPTATAAPTVTATGTATPTPQRVHLPLLGR